MFILTLLCVLTRHTFRDRKARSQHTFTQSYDYYSVEETQTVYFKLGKKLLLKATIKETLYNFRILQYRKTMQIVRFDHQERNGRKYHFRSVLLP